MNKTKIINEIIDILSIVNKIFISEDEWYKKEASHISIKLIDLLLSVDPDIKLSEVIPSLKKMYYEGENL